MARKEWAIGPERIVPGAVFSTPFESGCVVVTTPDDYGNFDALDSDGVRCQFTLAMVVALTKEAGA